MRHLLTLLLLAACAPGPLPDVAAVFDPSGDGFFDTPFPSDARRTSGGTADWTTFPNPSRNPLFQRYLDLASERQGFGQNTPIYLRFDGPFDTALLPGPDEALDPSAAVQLVDVTPGSPTFGQRTPIRWEVREEAGTYVPEHLLAVAPWPGWPLRPRTTYALVVTTDLARPDPAFVEAFETGAGDWGASLELLREALPRLDLRADDIAVATTFTTADPLGELDRVARFLDERVGPPVFRDPLDHLEDVGDAYVAWRTDYATPNFMEGEKPYDTAGGRFRWRQDGMPLVQHWEPMRLAVITPPDLSDPPPNGWPVVVFVDGTGGDYRSWARRSDGFEPATWITAAGAVGLGIDLPLHGARATPDTSTSLHSFNVLQPDSALHIHRQAAVDLLYLLDALTDGPVVLHTPDGTPVPLDPERVVFMGHSQGSLTGAIALPWMGRRVRGVMLSGAGGLIAITAVERKETVDFAALITTMLGFAEHEELTELHPVLGLIQYLVEPTDPINYGPYWFSQDGGLYGQAPVPVLLTSGLNDNYTPTRTAEALASAAGLPFVGKRRTQDAGMTLRGFERGLPLPAADTVVAFDGTPLTAGYSQWADTGHFAVFQVEGARNVARNFLISALNGTPEIRGGEAPALER